MLSWIWSDLIPVLSDRVRVVACSYHQNLVRQDVRKECTTIYKNGQKKSYGQKIKAQSRAYRDHGMCTQICYFMRAQLE